MATTDVNLLRQSIKHWEHMRDNVHCGETPYAQDCPLCLKYLDMRMGCAGCQVCEEVNNHRCHDTPFKKVREEFESFRFCSPNEMCAPNKDDYYETRKKRWQDAVQNMIDFLKNILEKRKKVKK